MTWQKASLLFGTLLAVLGTSASCCLPLALIGMAGAGAWMHQARLQAWQPYFLASSLLLVSAALRLAFRTSRKKCGAQCASPLHRGLTRSCAVLVLGLLAAFQLTRFDVRAMPAGASSGSRFVCMTCRPEPVPQKQNAQNKTRKKAIRTSASGASKVPVQ